MMLGRLRSPGAPAAGLETGIGLAERRITEAETVKWQGLADQATEALHAGRVTVHVIAGQRGAYFCQARQIDLGTDMPEANVKFLLAHELGHHLHGDCAEGVQAAELSANETAIQVLQVWGYSDYAAARLVARALWLLAKEQVRLGRGHRSQRIGTINATSAGAAGVGAVRPPP